MLRYTLMRLGIFVGCLVVVWGLVYAGVFPRGLGESNGMWIILLALLLSAPVSFVVLREERDRASVQIVTRMERAKADLEANRSQEDEADDAARAGDTARADDSGDDDPSDDGDARAGDTAGTRAATRAEGAAQ